MATPSDHSANREALKKAILAWAEHWEREYARYRSWWPDMLREYKENRRRQEKS